MNIVVIGGGVVGQTFQHYVPSARILDYRPVEPGRVPQNMRAYGATYLWEPLPEMQVVRSFPVTTHIDGAPGTVESVTRYKVKVKKAHELHDPTYIWQTQFQTHMTGYECAWPTPRIDFGCRVTSIDLDRQTLYIAKEGVVRYDYLISCIPLYALLKMIGWIDPGLVWHPVYMKIMTQPPDSATRPGDMYVNYLSGAIPPYRYTDRDGERHFESLVPMSGRSSVRLVPGKIIDHPRGGELVRVLRRYKVWCFGRYAAWSSDELLHHTAHQILAWRNQYGTL